MDNRSLPPSLLDGLDPALLDAYCSGTCTALELRQIDRWVGTNPARRAALAKLRRGLETPLVYPPFASAHAVAARVHAVVAPNGVARDPHAAQRVEAPRTPLTVLGRGRSRAQIMLQNTHRHSRAIAFALVGVIVAIATFVRSPINHNHAVQQFRTAFGQRSTVRFRDGSAMTLAPSTTVNVTGQGIDVTGEAYFDIAPHASHPVTVRTSTAIVRVLGTAFAVRQYADERNARVVVNEGRVSVVVRRHATNGGKPAILAARTLAQVTDSGITVLTGIAPRDYVSWTHGTLVFKGATLRDVVAELARAYGKEIRVADPTLAESLVRIEVSVSDDPIGQVLQTLCNVTGAHVTSDRGTYVLSPGRSATRDARVAPVRHHISLPRPEPQYGR